MLDKEVNMEWVIPEFPNYKINKQGVIFSKRKGYRKPTGTWVNEENWKPLKSVLDKGTGYYLVTMVRYEKDGTRVKKNQFIHRLLGRAFLPNPKNKAHINHKDGNKTNNNLDNLEWATEQENSRHAVDTGLTSYEYCEVVIQQFTDDWQFVEEFKSIHEAGRQTGIAYQNISKVVRGLRSRAGGFRWKYK